MYSALRLPLLALLFVIVWSSGWIGAKYLLQYAGSLMLSVLSLTLASEFCRYSERSQINRPTSRTPLLLILLIQSIAALIGFVILTASFGDFTVTIAPQMFVSLAYMSLVVSIGSYFLYFFLLRELPAVKGASLGYLTPPVTMILAWLWLRESLTVVDLGGLLLAFIAVVMVTRQSTKTDVDNRDTIIHANRLQVLRKVRRFERKLSLARP